MGRSGEIWGDIQPSPRLQAEREFTLECPSMDGAISARLAPPRAPPLRRRTSPSASASAKQRRTKLLEEQRRLGVSAAAARRIARRIARRDEQAASGRVREGELPPPHRAKHAPPPPRLARTHACEVNTPTSGREYGLVPRPQEHRVNTRGYDTSDYSGMRSKQLQTSPLER